MDLKEALRFEKIGKFDEALRIAKELPTIFDFQSSLMKIRMLYKKGDFIKGLNMAKSVKSEFKITDSNFDLMELSILLSKLHIAMGNPELAEYILKSLEIDMNAISNENLEINKIILGRYYYTKGLFYENRSNWKDAIIHYNLATELFEHLNFKQDYASSIYNIGTTLQKQGKLDQALKHLENSLEIRNKIGNKYEIFDCLNIIGIIKAKQGNFNKSLAYFKKCLVISNEIQDLYKKSKVFNNLGNISKIKGEAFEAKNYFQKAIENSEQIGDINTLSTATINLGTIHITNGHLDDAINTYSRVLSLIEKSGNKQQLGYIFNNMGIIYEKKGEFNNAINYYKKSLNITEELENKADIARSLTNVGKIHLLQGNLDIANEFMQKSFKIFDILDNKKSMSEVSMNIGLIYHKKGEYENSQKYLLKSLEYRTSLGNDLLISESVFALITMYLDKPDIKQAEHYYKKLQKSAKKSKNKVIYTRQILAEAALLQSSHKISKKAEAQNLFEKVMNEELVDFELTVFAMLNLCEFLLLELKSTNDEGTLTELNYLVNKLHEIAIEQESYNLISEILIIQSKLALLQTNIKEARFLIDQAITIADGRNIDQIKLKATLIKAQLESKIDEWSEVAFQNIPISEKIDELELEEFIKNMYMKKESTDMFVHDIKNLLQINLNVANLLSINNALPDNMKEYVNLLESSSREIQMLISSYMTSDKLENGTFNVHYELVDLKKFINERIGLFKLKIDSNHLQVIQNMPDENYLIKCDRFLIGRIFDNMIHNAVKFTPKNGDIMVDIQQTSTEQVIKISNDGPVIPKEFHDKLFEKYQQYKGKGSKTTSGFGLGLAFCKRAIEKMEGTITIESPIEGSQEGVAFTIILPR